MKLTDNTIEMLRHFVKMNDRWARLLNIRRDQFIKSGGGEYYLNTMMELQEAGKGAGRHSRKTTDGHG